MGPNAETVIGAVFHQWIQLVCRQSSHSKSQGLHGSEWICK